MTRPPTPPTPHLNMLQRLFQMFSSLKPLTATRDESTPQTLMNRNYCCKCDFTYNICVKSGKSFKDVARMTTDTIRVHVCVQARMS